MSYSRGLSTVLAGLVSLSPALRTASAQTQTATVPPQLVWQQLSPTLRQLSQPVLYQIIFRSSATPGNIPVISPTFTLMNSHIADDGLSLQLSEPANFVSGQVFPGVLPLGGGTMTGSISFAAGQTFPSLATLGANTFTGNQTVNGNVLASGYQDLSGNNIRGISGTQEFIASGSFIVPAGITRLLVQAYGSGGGGAGGRVGVGITPSGGGGGGAYASGVISVTSGDTLTITVGAGGAGGLSGATAQDGGNGGITQIVNSSATLLISAAAGLGGLGASSVNGGPGGAAGTLGSINHAGIAGQSGKNSGTGAPGYNPPGFATITTLGGGGNTGSQASPDGQAGQPGYVIIFW